MNRESIEKYRDIINLPHHVSLRHPQMSMSERAAQFSPFAALSGHDAAIAEASRLTEDKPVQDESVKQEISDRLQAAGNSPGIVLNIVHFVPDSRKPGGCFAVVTGHVRKLIPHEDLVIMEDGEKIKAENIVSVRIMSQPQQGTPPESLTD